MAQQIPLVTVEGQATLKNKIIKANENTISGIDAGNLKPYTAADKGKTFVINDTGGWVVGGDIGKTYYKEVSTLEATGSSDTLYYLRDDWTTFKRGLYVWLSSSSSYGQAERDVGTATVVCDNVTISQEGGAVHVLDANTSGTTGITVGKININSLSTEIPVSGSVDAKIPTEKAVANALTKKVSRVTEGTGIKTITGLGVYEIDGVITPFINIE